MGAAGEDTLISQVLWDLHLYLTVRNNASIHSAAACTSADPWCLLNWVKYLAAIVKWTNWW